MTKCKHEGNIRWMITGRLTNTESLFGRKYSKQEVPVLHCNKCDKTFIIEFKNADMV